jgi:AraC-like DNA-binding protein
LKSLRQFPRHSHDQFGIGVIDSGGHRSWSGLGWVEAICGDIIMVNPGEMHDGLSLAGKPRSWTMLFFEPRIACEILVDGPSNSIPTLRPTVRDRDQAIRFRRLFAAVTDPQPDALRMDQEFVTTFAHAFRHHASRRPLRSSGLPSIHRILRIIDREPERPLSLQAMADMAGVSRFHFLRTFCRLTGATPHAYILQQRVRLARRLLAAGRELGQASADSGFADQSHMTRAFVRQLGMTPARYRQVISEPKRAISFKTALSNP